MPKVLWQKGATPVRTASRAGNSWCHEKQKLAAKEF
jgi:hypothetical protein